MIGVAHEIHDLVGVQSLRIPLSISEAKRRSRFARDFQPRRSKHARGVVFASIALN